MVNFQRIKDTLDKNGEVMVKIDSGETLEPHKHNVSFDDPSEEIIVDAGIKTYWIPSEKISYYWIHKEDIEK